MEIPLQETYVTLTQKKVKKTERESKLCNSLNKIIMRTGHQWLKKTQKNSKMECTLANNQVILQ